MHSSVSHTNIRPRILLSSLVFHCLISETMARQPVFIVLIALFLLAAVTSAMDTATDFDDDNQGPLQRCRQQIQRQRLRHCEQFVTRPRRYLQLLETVEEETDDEENTPEYLRECCQELRSIDDPCRCEGLRQIVQRKRQQGRLQGVDVGQMMERASNLPSICRLQGRRRCDVRSVRY